MEEEWVFVGHPTETDLRLEHFGEISNASERPQKVVFTEPAKHWTDAAPLGNGSLGVMVWGGVSHELLQLNHDTLWTGVPGDYTNPQSPPILSEVRKLVDDGKYPQATAAAFGLSGNPPDVYQPLGDMNLEFGKSHDKYDSYRRELDLDTASVKVNYVAEDMEFTREHFCSNPHQVLVVKISANKPASISFTVFLDSKLHHHSTVNGDNQIIMNGSCPGKRIPPKVSASKNANPKGIQFAASLDLQISDDAGVVTVLDHRKLRVEGSNWAVLILSAASSFDGPFTMPVDSKKDPVSHSINILNLARNMSFSRLYAYHLDDYQELFRRVTLQLSKGRRQRGNEHSLRLKDAKNEECCAVSCEADMFRFSNSTSTKTGNVTLISTAERIKSFKDDEDPTLVELLFQYGRYLLISCSRPGTQAANLQGIWNKDMEPAWDAAPHLNINMQMNYWPALSCNLSECQLPLFDFISSLAANGTKTAKGIFDWGDNPDAVKSILKHAGALHRGWRMECKKGFFMNKQYENIIQNPPPRVQLPEWKLACDHWMREDTILQSNKCSQNRATAPSCTHLLGRRSIDAPQAKYVATNEERKMDRVAVFEATHSRIRSDGDREWLNSHYEEIHVNYGTDGWVAHQVSDIWGKTSPDHGDPVWALWQMGGAWLSTHLWEYYTYTMDKDFLKTKAYPLLEGCASFLLDWLIEGKGVFLETNPSTSPEHSFISPDGKLSSVSYSCTMDIAIIREVFKDIVAASEVLTRETDLVKRVRKALARLPPTRIARDGSIMEWAQDFKDPDVHHRLLAHLFGLFPGHTITLEKTPDLCKAADYSLHKRGDAGPGWSLTWKMALWAHLRNEQHAYKLIKLLFILVDPEHEHHFEGGLYSNLFTAHPPFQIDANFGFSSAIAEMLVQSTETDLFLLPALPREKWANGCVKGLKARGNVTVSISWKEGALHETLLWTDETNQTRKLHYNGLVGMVKLSHSNSYLFNGNLRCTKISARV